MSVSDRQIAAIALLIKINVITGWVVPADETISDILTDQFIKKLSESYSNVNPDEMEYAFRTFGTVVKDWGKNMNLSLIDEVMIPYLEQRSEVSKIEEQKKLPAPEQRENMSDISMLDWLEYTKNQVKDGKISVDIMPVMLYDWLIKTGRMEVSEKKRMRYLERAVWWKHDKLLSQAEDKEGAEMYREFKGMKEKGVFSGPYVKELESLASKMIFWDAVLKEKI